MEKSPRKVDLMTEDDTLTGIRSGIGNDAGGRSATEHFYIGDDDDAHEGVISFRLTGKSIEPAAIQCMDAQNEIVDIAISELTNPAIEQSSSVDPMKKDDEIPGNPSVEIGTEAHEISEEAIVDLTEDQKTMTMVSSASKPGSEAAEEALITQHGITYVESHNYNAPSSHRNWHRGGKEHRAGYMTDSWDSYRDLDDDSWPYRSAWSRS